MLASSFKGNAKERLVSSREYVRLQYAAAALPLLEYLTAEASRVAPNDVVLRWTRLREAIEGYEKGNLSNGIYELERYVLSLAKLRGANECVSFLEERQLPVQRGDYFSKQLINLDETVTSGCEQRITQGQRQSYENFAKWFNSTIAGRPPFSSNGWYGGHAALAIPQFERLLSRYSELRQPMLADTKNEDSWPTDVGVFIARMDQLAAYFLTPKSLNKPAVKNPNGPAKLAIRNDDVRSDMPFRARLEFRSGRRHEAGADQIMDWSISSGARRHTSRGTDLFQWKIGEPIEVQLRWAADSPVSPLALQSKIYNYTASERIASFKYSGDWALFELLEKHKSDVLDTDSGVGLFFPVPTLGPQGRQDAKAFISLHSPDGINALVPDFPPVAPLYPRNGSN
jgi:type VI secretion system protein ImpL